MERTLLVGDFLFVNKLVYGAEIPGTGRRLPALAEPQRGDVVVFKFPKDPALNYVKRVVASGGDTVEMRKGTLLVNGGVVEEPYAIQSHGRFDPRDVEFEWQRDFYVGRQSAQARYRPTRDTWGPLWVPHGKYFVLGDNRENSSDSRYWGFVDAVDVRGRPEFVYFSYDRHGTGLLPFITSVRWRRLGEIIR